MIIDSKLLEILVCPKCKTKVDLTTAGNALRCANPDCRLVYPIRDGIPVMLIEEAKIEE